MSLGRVICGLLAGQALGVSVIRSAALEAVEANGEVQGLRSVDASTAEGILAQVEDMVKHHVKMDKPKIATIQELTTQLETALADTHQSAQNQVGSNLLAIEKCNEDKASTFSEIAATTKKTVEAERKAHSTCRDAEMETHVDMVKKCKHLKSWLKSLSSPEKTGSDDDAMVEWVGKMDGYWCPKGETAKEKSKTCKKAKADHKAAKEKCDPLQSQFELGFCTWRVELIDACGAHTTCYDAALKTYKDHKVTTQQLIVQWKTEYVALKKISCYVNVWLSDDDATTVDADQLTECQDLQPDKSKMNIDFKSPADKAECSLAEVAKYPGTDSFKQTEYEKFLDVKETIGEEALSHFINEPTPCDGTETTTEITTFQ
jgi:hypothetical protein